MLHPQVAKKKTSACTAHACSKWICLVVSLFYLSLGILLLFLEDAGARAWWWSSRQTADKGDELWSRKVFAITTLVTHSAGLMWNLSPAAASFGNKGDGVQTTYRRFQLEFHAVVFLASWVASSIAAAYASLPLPLLVGKLWLDQVWLYLCQPVFIAGTRQSMAALWRLEETGRCYRCWSTFLVYMLCPVIGVSNVLASVMMGFRRWWHTPHVELRFSLAGLVGLNGLCLLLAWTAYLAQGKRSRLLWPHFVTALIVALLSSVTNSLPPWFVLTKLFLDEIGVSFLIFATAP